MSDDLVSKRRAERCTTHSHACDCREYAHAQEIERLRAEVADLRRINQFDGAELRALCAARDEARRERDALRARAERAERRIADAPTAEVTLGCYLDADQLPPELALRRVALVVLDE